MPGQGPLALLSPFTEISSLKQNSPSFFFDTTFSTPRRLFGEAAVEHFAQRCWRLLVGSALVFRPFRVQPQPSCSRSADTLTSFFTSTWLTSTSGTEVVTSRDSFRVFTVQHSRASPHPPLKPTSRHRLVNTSHPTSQLCLLYTAKSRVASDNNFSPELSNFQKSQI